MLSTFLGDGTNGLHSELFVPVSVEIVIWLARVSPGCNAARVMLSVLGTWGSMDIKEELDVVLLAPADDTIDVWLVLLLGDRLKVLVPCGDIIRGIRSGITWECDPIPVAGWDPEEFDSVLLHLGEVLLLDIVV